MEEIQYDDVTLASFARQTENGVLVTNAQGEIEWANDKFLQCCGYSLKEVQGRKPGTLLQGADTDIATIRKIGNAIRQKKCCEADILNYKKNGQIYWQSLSITPIFDEEGAIEKFISFQKDITQKKQQEQKLIALNAEMQSMQDTINEKMETAISNAQNDLRALIENTTDSIWSIDHNYQLRTLNSVFAKFFKDMYGKELKLGANFLDQVRAVMKPEKFFRYKVWLEEAMDGEALLKEDSFLLENKNYFYQVSFNPIRSDNGEVTGVSVFGKDITSIKQNQEVLKSRETALLEVAQDLDMLIYRASHDFRGPVATIKGLLNLMRINGERSQTDLEYLHLLDFTTNRLDELIMRMNTVTYTRKEAIINEVIDTEALVHHIADSLPTKPQDAGLSVIIDNKYRHTFASDAFRLETIFKNLLDNAVKYLRKQVDSFCLIELSGTVDVLEIVIQDNGKGIPDGYKNRIFGMFNRSGAETSGSGLGLYVVKVAVEKIGGSIVLNHTMGTGVCIQIKIPNKYSSSANANH